MDYKLGKDLIHSSIRRAHFCNGKKGLLKREDFGGQLIKTSFNSDVITNEVYILDHILSWLTI